MSVVITNAPRVDRETVEGFAPFGVATVHEAQGRTGLLGTVKETLGSVNVPIVCAGQIVQPGDLIVADDDGVVVIPRAAAKQVLRQSKSRAAKKAQTRARVQAGELGLDIYGMREKLAQKGLVYRAANAEG